MLAQARTLLTASQAREAALHEEVLALDRETDARVEGMVNLLKGVKDSTTSNTEVANTKRQAIEGLKRWVGQLFGGSSPPGPKPCRKW